MTEHQPVYERGTVFVTHCECGWGAGTSFGGFEEDVDVRQDIHDERAKAKLLAAKEAERDRLSTQGQNWRMP